MSEGPLLKPEIQNVGPLESGIEFFQEQKKFTFLFTYQFNKVFLNHVDSYNGRHILRYIGGREYTKPMEFVEPAGEVQSVSTDAQPAPSSQPSLKSVAMESEGLPPRDDSLNWDSSKPVVSDALNQLKTDYEFSRTGEDQEAKDSLVSLLGGLLTTEQVSVLKSLPTRLLRAEYLRNILNQLNPETVLPSEEDGAGITSYEISGTLKYCDECLQELQVFLKERVRDLKAYLPTLLSCSTVIFDISRDPSQIEEARWALRAIVCSFKYLEKKSMSCFRNIKDVRKFILISSAMTWENTDKMKIRKKTVTEENLSIRKPHHLFKEHKYLEQEVIRAGTLYPHIFKTYVLASGIPYGYEEDRLNYLFDLGWRNEAALPLLGDGHNSLPIIHVEDLAMLVFHCMVRVFATPSYFFAVEKNPPTLLQITEGISKGLTTGKTSMHPVDHPLPLNINIHEDTYAMLTSELLLEPDIHKLDLPWKYNMNMIHNMAAIVDEYIEYRNLYPFKVLVGGPPACGKTKLAQRIAQIYDLKYISVEETVENYIEKLEREAIEKGSAKTDMDDADDEKQDYEEEDKVDEYAREDEATLNSKPLFRNELEEIKYNMATNNGLLDDAIIIRILKRRLEEQDALNHGYILDSWPESAPQAHGLFGRDDDEDLSTPELSEEEEEKASSSEEEFFGEEDNLLEIKTRNINAQPNFLIQLDGDCDDILFRVLAAKEDLMRQQPSSVRLAERMDQYRDMEKMGCRAFDYFDNKFFDLRILKYKLISDPCPFLGKTLKHILDSLGPPTNTGFLKRYLEEYKLIRRAQANELEKNNKERGDGIEKMDVEYFRAATQFMDKWVYFKDNVIKERSKFGGLNDQLLPQSVLDTAIRALIEFKETSPDDHYEFLAEYFLHEYEKEKGRPQVSAPKVDTSVAFRRCVSTVLERCDPVCLPLLPQAVDVIMKYRRFAEAKGSTFPPESCRDTEAKKKSFLSEPDSQMGEFFYERSSNTSFFGSKPGEEKTFSSKSLGQISLEKLAELLIKTNPIWKATLSTNKVDKKLAISDESLKILLEQLRQLSCEIRYRLKKRGVTAFDSESLLGSCGEWPHKGPERECSGEIKTKHPSQPSIDTRKNMEDLKKAELDALMKKSNEVEDARDENLSNIVSEASADESNSIRSACTQIGSITDKFLQNSSIDVSIKPED